MARKRHTPEEIVGKLRQVEVLVGQGKPVTEATRATGVLESTYYRWRAGYEGLKPDQVRQLKRLEQEIDYVDSFNGKFRDEPIACEAFNTLAEAKVLIKQWRKHYSIVRPHSSLSY